MKPIQFKDIDDYIEELQRIGETQGLTLYSILFRNAGVGLLWFSEKLAGPPPVMPKREEGKLEEFIEGMKQYNFLQSQWIKKGLAVEKYYPSLSEALEGERARFGWQYRPMYGPPNINPIDPSGIG